jgi:nucleoside-diphosphate-sugar epimerase
MSTTAKASKRLLIVGASGLIGSRITNAIVQNKKSFDRIAIFTSPNTVQTKVDFIKWLKGEGVEIIEGDATNSDDIKRAYKGNQKCQQWEQYQGD